MRRRSSIRSKPVQAVVAGLAAVAASCEPAPAPTISSVQGTWSGPATRASETVQIRFILTDDVGTLGGEGTFGDPKTLAFGPLGSPLTGSREGDRASWTTMTGLQVSGTFTDKSFTGSLRFPPEEPASTPVVASLTLVWRSASLVPTAATGAVESGSTAVLVAANIPYRQLPVVPCGTSRG